jgi:hypothetical protein
MTMHMVNGLTGKRLLPLAWLMVGFVLAGHAQSKVGTTAAQFLGIGVGPKAIAMGGAFVASHEDATLLYWNPGAFAQAGRSQVVFSNTDWLVGTKFRWFGGMFNLDGENAIGLSFTQLDYGEEEVTTVEQPDGNGQRWSASDLAIGLSYSRNLTDRFSLGGTVKYVSQNIWNETASTFAFDLGLLFVTGFNDMRLGVSMTNFGGDLQLEGRDLLQKVDIDPNNSGSNKDLVGTLKTDPWALPLTFRVGVAMDVYKDEEMRVTLAADAIRPTDAQESVNIGGELGWRESVFLRGGFKSAVGGGTKISSREDVQEGLTLGAGLKYRQEGLATLEVHYAFSKFGVFGNLNTISVALGF